MLGHRTAGGAASDTLLLLACLMLLLKSSHTARRWKTLYMDDEDNCVQMLIRNDDLEEADTYNVQSDQWQGRSTWSRKPAECTIALNLGDRLVGVNLLEWRCDEVYKEPFLDVYDNCDGTRKNQLAHYNCSNARPVRLSSTGTCVTLYHYRGHTRSGYFFSVELIAKYEVIAFPAGGIAALILASIIAIMLVVKIACLVTGYENKLPVINIDPEDPKQTLLNLDLSTSHKDFLQETSLQGQGATCSEIEMIGGGGAGSSLPTPGIVGTGATPPAPRHTLLDRSSHSSTFTPLNGTPTHDPCWDSDSMETYSPPKLKRYCSVRASRILRL